MKGAGGNEERLASGMRERGFENQMSDFGLRYRERSVYGPGL